MTEDAHDLRYRDREWLIEQYHDKGLTQAEIGDLCGVERATVGDWMRKYDIETRSKGRDKTESGITDNVVTDGDRELPESARQTGWRDPEYLRTAYWEEGQVCADIAEEHGIDRAVVSYWMKHYDIPVRSGQDSRELSKGVTSLAELRVEYGLDESLDPEYMDTESCDWRSLEYLLDTYWFEGKSITDIVESTDASSYRGVHYWLSKHDIPVRSQEDGRRLQSGAVTLEALREEYGVGDPNADGPDRSRDIGWTDVADRSVARSD